MTRIAHCCCGTLRAEATGEPAFVAACHCMVCQRRTGSPFGVSTYFRKEQVRTEGPSKVYLRGSGSNSISAPTAAVRLADVSQLEESDLAGSAIAGLDTGLA
jgi:hypothetical protein